MKEKSVIKTVYHFLDSALGVEISQKREVNVKREGEFRNLLYLGWGERLTLGKEGFAWGTRGRGKYTD